MNRESLVIGETEPPTLVNSILNEKSPDESLDSFLSSFSMKLMITLQESTDQLETSIVEALLVMPRVHSEISVLEEHLKLLSKERKKLATQLRSFDNKTVHGVDDLSRLDIVKNNMNKCKITLEEYARWNQIVREVKKLLQGGGRLSDSADSVSRMIQSMKILQNMPKHEERSNICNELSHTLFVALQPQVRKLILDRDLNNLHDYVYAYDKLERKNELEIEYVSAIVAKIGEQWSRLASESVDQYFSNLKLFLDNLARIITEEVMPTEFLFGVSRRSNVIGKVLGISLTSVCSNISQFTLKLTNPDTFVDLYQLLDNFAYQVCNFLFWDGDVESSYDVIVNILSIIYNCINDSLSAYIIAEVSCIENKLSILVQMKKESISILDDAQENGINVLDSVDSYDMYSCLLLDIVDNFADPIISFINRSCLYFDGLYIESIVKPLCDVLVTFIKQFGAKIDNLWIAFGDYLPNNKVSTTNEYGLNGLEVSDLGGRIMLSCILRSLQATGRLYLKLQSLEILIKEKINCNIPKKIRESPVTKIILNSSRIDKSFTGISLVELWYHQFTQIESSSVISNGLEFKTLMSSNSTFPNLIPINLPVNMLRENISSVFFELCTIIPERMLIDLHKEDVWFTGHTMTQADYDNILPQPAFTQIGEYMLSFIHELEMFVSTGASSDLLGMMSVAEVMIIKSRNWIQLEKILGLIEVDST